VLRVKAAVLGSPVAHSLSPILHNAAYAALGLDHTYSAIETTELSLGAFLSARDTNWLGVSLTMPLKEVAFEFADSCDELAQLTGAINTYVFKDGIQAFNTDVLGIVDALTEIGSNKVTTGAIFGSGATARSSLIALHSLGAQIINCVARNQTDIDRMAKISKGVDMDFQVTSVADSNWMAADVVINTTPVGVLDDVAREVFSPSGVLLDVVYNPWPTQLAASWSVTGGSIVSGLSMLLHQAGHQVTLMTGEPAPIVQMREALNVELLARGLSAI
jgi:shikimate dehydrogenase